ncbi:hypothetical protein [Flavobacterium flavipallidum]|uniref:Uncharacterized protein n=1 Tax=Flavobacterium flavipallidum TaxID=3139140 RepID=A0ABU9HI25_9FLAO
MKRISNLETQYEQQTQKQFFYKTQLEESQELEKKIRSANVFLNEAIFDLNKELFGELFLKNNL